MKHFNVMLKLMDGVVLPAYTDKEMSVTQARALATTLALEGFLHTEEDGSILYVAPAFIALVMVQEHSNVLLPSTGDIVLP